MLQDKAEAKIRALEAKAEEQRKVRAIADAQWQQQQRQRELKRLRVGSASFSKCVTHDHWQTGYYFYKVINQSAYCEARTTARLYASGLVRVAASCVCSSRRTSQALLIA